MSPRSPFRGMLREHASLLIAALHVVDWVIVAMAGWLAYWLYLGSPSLPAQYEAALVIGVLAAGLVFPRFDAYRAWRGASLLDELRNLGTAWGVVVLGLVFLAFATKMGENFSRVWVGLWAVLGVFGLVMSRVILRTLLTVLRKRGFNQRRIVIVGVQELGREVAARLQSAPWTGLQIAGFFSESDDRHTPMPGDLPVLGRIRDLGDYVEIQQVDQVWLALPLRAQDQIMAALHELRQSTVDIRFVPEMFGLRLMHHSLTDVAGLPVMNLSVSPMEGMNRVIKALEDRILALFILLLISPLLALIALVVKLDAPGPVLFRQQRHGWDSRPIEVWKFRSMHAHPEPPSYRQATRDDPRLTRVGAFLRRTSLDELPQFFNVLQGRMSIVGPRPHPIQMNWMYKDQVDGYMRRHQVKPGITGWAQINGYRGETDTMEKIRKRIEYDLYYIENWSLWFDLKIIILTIVRGFTHKNAY